MFVCVCVCVCVCVSVCVRACVCVCVCLAAQEANSALTCGCSHPVSAWWETEAVPAASLMSSPPPHRAGATRLWLQGADCCGILPVSSSSSSSSLPCAFSTPALTSHSDSLSWHSQYAWGLSAGHCLFHTGGLMKRETTHMCGHSAVRSTNRTSNFMLKWVIVVPYVIIKLDSSDTYELWLIFHGVIIIHFHPWAAELYCTL